MIERRIGALRVSAIGLGGAPWSVPSPSDDALSIATIDEALDDGVTLIDTAHAYTTADVVGHNESLIAAALAGGRRENVVVASKGGHYRDGNTWPIDGRPETIMRHCDDSLRSLQVETIDLYQLHFPDPDVPIKESVGAIAELQRAGKVANIGVSNVDVGQLRDATEEADIVSVQNRARVTEETEVMIGACENAGIAFLAYAPLGGQGFEWAAVRTDPELADIAGPIGISVPRLVLAYWLNRSPVVIPLVGSRRPESIRDSVGAADIELSLEASELTENALRRLSEQPPPPN